MVGPPAPLSWAPLLTAIAVVALPCVAALAFLGTADDSDFFAALVFVGVAAVVLGLSMSVIGAVWWVIRALDAHGRLPASAIAGIAAWSGGIAVFSAWLARGSANGAWFALAAGCVLAGELLVAIGAQQALPPDRRLRRRPRLPSPPRPPLPA
jgi:hypothetical protein